MTNLTPARIDKLAAALDTALAAHHVAVEAEAGARARLADREAELLLRGAPGKNEAERKAWLHAELTDEREAAERAAADTRAARSAVERARVEWDAMRYTLRLLEVAGGGAA